MNDYLRVPPNNEEAEVAVLGSCMLDQPALEIAIKYLDNTSFYKEKHNSIFRAMSELSMKGEPVDQVTLTNYLGKMDILSKVGGAYYITGLVESIPSSAKVEYYAKIVLEKSLLRKIITFTSEIQDQAYQDKVGATDLLAESERRFMEIIQAQEGGQFKDFISFHDALQRFIEEFTAVRDGKTEPGIKSGLIDLDDYICGFEPGLYLLGGRPGQGKTALALKIARNVAKRGIPVGFVSLETSDIKLVRRIIAGEAKVDSMLLKTGKVNQDDFIKVIDTCNNLSKLPIFIDDSYYTNVRNIITRAKILKRSKGIKLLFVDYLQLLDSGVKSETRNLEIGNISRALKIFSEREKIPVIALAQLNRNPKDKMPVLTDLRDSGNLEQDSDVVMFIFRPETANQKALSDGSSTKNIALVSVAKNRDGGTGEFKLTFEKQYVLFENYVKQMEAPF